MYHKTIATFEDLEPFVKLAIEDYNNRPNAVLNGLTPIEVQSGKLPANVSFTEQTKQATQNRIIENKKATCCFSI